MVSKAKYKAKYRRGLKILTPKHIIQRYPIRLAKVKPGNISKNVWNEIRQFIYPLYRAKEITKKVYNNTIKSMNL